jgi:hypothetical protein
VRIDQPSLQVAERSSCPLEVSEIARRLSLALASRDLSRDFVRQPGYAACEPRLSRGKRPDGLLALIGQFSGLSPDPEITIVTDFPLSFQLRPGSPALLVLFRHG